jgi:hypothetical protein
MLNLQVKISVQRNLKCFDLTLCHDLTFNELTSIIPSLILTKLPNTLIKLKIRNLKRISFSLTFIANFLNMQELELLFINDECFGEFEKLQYAIFPQLLKVLRIPDFYPKNGLLITFLENNGKNLEEIYISDNVVRSDSSINLAISKFCSNLKKLSIGIKHNELETLKIIFNNCKNLESIKIWCGKDYLSEKEALEAFAKYSQNIHELILSYQQYEVRSKLLPEELESFFLC